MEKELAEAQSKPRAFRYRHMDHEARQAASQDEVERFEEALERGDRTIGLYPCGDDIDVQNAIEELEREKKKADKEDIEFRCIMHFLKLDMGMTDLVFEELDEELEDWHFEGSTCFLRFTSRRGVITIYSHAGLMNRMAVRRRVSRKLHLWVPPQLENRFFQLKDLEWQFRRMKRNNKESCHTRLCYSNGSIMAQWRSAPDRPYVNIREPPSQHIAGVEFWRKASIPKLNRRPAGPPIHKPDLKALTTPKGRVRNDERKDERKTNIKPIPRQPKFDDDAGSRPTPGTGANAVELSNNGRTPNTAIKIADSDDEDRFPKNPRAKIDASTIPTKEGKKKGGKKSKGNKPNANAEKKAEEGKKEDEPAASGSGTAPPNKEEEKMEDDSWKDEDGQLKSASKVVAGNERAVNEMPDHHSKATPGRGRGRPKKLTVSISNTPKNQRSISDFIKTQSLKKPAKRTREERRDEDRSDSDEDLGEEKKAVKLDDDSKDLVKALRESCEVSAKRGANYAKLKMHAKQERRFYRKTEKQILKGEQPSFAILAVKNKMLGKVGKRLKSQLLELDTEAKAVTYDESSTTSSSETDSDSSVYGELTDRITEIFSGEDDERNV